MPTVEQLCFKGLAQGPHSGSAGILTHGLPISSPGVSQGSNLNAADICLVAFGPFLCGWLHRVDTSDPTFGPHVFRDLPEPIIFNVESSAGFSDRFIIIIIIIIFTLKRTSLNYLTEPFQHELRYFRHVKRNLPIIVCCSMFSPQTL